MTTDSSEQTTYCEVHPDRETGLRCNKCGRYMCVQCAVSTPVGYRCRECVRRVDDKFFTGTQNDDLIIGALCGLSALAVGFITAQFRLPILIGLFGGVIIGNLLGTIGLRLTEKRRGRNTPNIAAGAVGVGGLIGAFLGGYNLEYLMLGFTNIGFSAPIFIGIIALMVYRRFELK